MYHLLSWISLDKMKQISIFRLHREQKRDTFSSFFTLLSSLSAEMCSLTPLFFLWKQIQICFVCKCENPQQSYSEEEEQLWTRRCALQVTLFFCLFVSGHLMASLTAQTTQNTLRKCSAAELKMKRDAGSERSAVCHAVRSREFLDAHRKASMRWGVLRNGVKFPARSSGSSSQ